MASLLVGMDTALNAWKSVIPYSPWPVSTGTCGSRHRACYAQAVGNADFVCNAFEDPAGSTAVSRTSEWSRVGGSMLFLERRRNGDEGASRNQRDCHAQLRSRAGWRLGIRWKPGQLCPVSADGMAAIGPEVASAILCDESLEHPSRSKAGQFTQRQDTSTLAASRYRPFGVSTRRGARYSGRDRQRRDAGDRWKPGAGR